MNILNKIEDILKYRVREKGYQNMIKKQKEEIDEYKTTIENYKEQIRWVKKEKIKKVQERTFLVDFIKINAFSIERTIDNNEQEETVIGYMDKNDNVKEWSLICSSETHEKLCEFFRKQILLKEIEIPGTSIE